MFRARIVLLAAASLNNTEIARQLQCTRKTARKWRGRFAEAGRAGLTDEPRPGCPPTYDDTDRAVITALACELPVTRQLPLSRMSSSDIHGEASRELNPCPSRSTIAAWLAQAAIRPWIYTSWVTPRDPQFEQKAAPVLDLYIAFTLYTDTLLSINQIAPFLGRAYRTVYDVIRKVEAAVHRGFPVVWQLLDQTIDGPVQVDESGKVCSGYKGQDPPRDSRHRGGSSRSGRSRWRGRHGDQLTLVGACRDSLRVIRGKHGIDYQDDLNPVIQEAEDLSQLLGEVWTDGLQAYREMERDHRAVVHDETYVSPEGVHINQIECLFSLVKPWLRKFRGLSKQGLEQAAHTFGIVRSLTLVCVSLEITIECLVMGAFRSSA